MLTKMAGLRLLMLTTVLLSATPLLSAQGFSLPTIDPDLPTGNFSCKGKVIGGYYADVDSGCQMFHVCTLDEKGKIRDIKFGCLPGTVFSQETRVCERTEEVDCSISESFFYLNDELYGPGIIPPTADTASTSSAATVKVLDPSVVLLAATIPPPASTDTSTEFPTPPPLPSAVAPVNPHLPVPVNPHLPIPSVVAPPPPPPPPPTAASPPPLPQVVTSSPPSPIINPGVTASSDGPNSRMSTSTSSSVTAAYSFPPLPFTVSRTSTSVSASSRVRIDTPLIQISLNQGIDLPAPHLRPSLLRLAAQAQKSGQNFGELNPTSPSPIISRTPADFEDVPRLSRSKRFLSNLKLDDHSIISSRQKRQVSPLRTHVRQRTRTLSTTEMSESKPVTLLSEDGGNRHRVISDTVSRTTSRGRQRFRAPVATQGSSLTRNPFRTSAPLLHNPPVTSSPVQITRVGNPRVRQRGRFIKSRQDSINTRSQNRAQEQSTPTLSSLRSVASTNRRQPPVADKSDSVIKSQQDSPIEENSSPLFSRPISQVSLDRQRVPSQKVTANESSRDIQVLRPQIEVRNPVVDTQLTPDSFTETVFHHESIAQHDPISLNDPTPLPPTVLTAELPPDSIHRVSDGATSGVDFVTTTQTAFVFPETSFSCQDKIPGGLYADVETGCVVFHICSVGPLSSIEDNKFVCGEGTLFDQKSRTCQAGTAVDCSLSESLYYLNDRLKGPVFLELEAQLPEQQFDFPRVPASPSSSSSSSPSSFSGARSSRFRRDSEDVVDLCHTQPLGTPLADLTSGCQNYMVCERQANWGTGYIERHYSCKKDYLFSQIQKRCIPSKKVNCVKETLSGILGLDSSNRGTNKRRLTRSLLLHRLKREALPPLVNYVKNAEREEDTRVHRAMLSLAALQRWVSENAHNTTFIEVYTLNTKEDYPKKSYGNRLHVNRYTYLHRKKRDVANLTSAEQALHDNETKAEVAKPEPALPSSFDNQEKNRTSGGVPINPTATQAGTLSTVTVFPTASSVTVFPTASSVTVSPTASSVTVSPTASSVTVSPTASSVTVSPTASSVTVQEQNTVPVRTTTVTVTPETVTVTNTVTVGLQPTEMPIINTAIPSVPQTPIESFTSLPIASSEVTGVNLVANVTTSAVNMFSNETSRNSTSSHESVNISGEMEEVAVEKPTPALMDGQDSNIDSSSQPQQTITEMPVLLNNITEDSTVPVPVVNSTLAASIDNLQENTSITPEPSTPQVETAVTEGPASNVTTVSPTTNATAITNSTTSATTTTTTPAPTTLVTTTTSVPSIAEVESPPENATTSTTATPSDISTSKNVSEVPITSPPTPTVGPYTRDNLPITNFTCKNKTLEQFYPDTEANCQVFHYCSPGFHDKEILDLKFLCTGATMFDVNTQKCENMTDVVCDVNTTTTTPTPTPPTTTPTPTTPTPTTPTTTPTPTTPTPNTTASVNISDTLPSVNVSDTLPSVNVSDTLPSVNVSDTLPSVNVSDTIPSVNVSDTIPSVNVSDPIPSVNVSDPIPSVNVSDTIPSVNISDTIPSVNVSDTIPTVNVSDTIPSVNVSDTIPSVNVSDTIPSVNITPTTITTPTTASSTTTPLPESVTVEPASEPASTELLTEIPSPDTGEEISTNMTHVSKIDTTTELIIDESVPTTELGPDMPMVLDKLAPSTPEKEKHSEIKLEAGSDPGSQLLHDRSLTTTTPASTTQLLESSSSVFPEALNNTNISHSVMNNSSTNVSKNIDTEAPL